MELPPGRLWKYNDNQCSRWDCPRLTSVPHQINRFCTNGQGASANAEAFNLRPVCIHNYLTNREFFNTRIHRVYSDLMANVPTGIPDVRADMAILTVPPWLQDGTFNLDLEVREEFRTWLFVSYVAPGNIWLPSFQMTTGNLVKTRFYMPQDIDRSWLLIRYLLDLERSFYLLTFIRPPLV